MTTSRVARRPIEVPKGVAIDLEADQVNVKGQKGSLSHKVPRGILLALEEGLAHVSTQGNDPKLKVLAGTTRAIINNLVLGVSQGYEKKLLLVGVGYRAVLQGRDLNLSLGFSHPVSYAAPEGITFEVPSQTEILIKGIDKQLVGQVAANIRAFRPPEPYKGKGVRYSTEVIVLKETKKK